jgi:hypothetical protein
MASLEMRSSCSMVREQKLPEFQPSLDLTLPHLMKLSSKKL